MDTSTTLLQEFADDLQERYVNDTLAPEIVAEIREHDPERFAVWYEARMYKYMMDFKAEFMKGTMDQGVLETFRANPIWAEVVQSWERERREALDDQNPTA